MLKKLKLSGLLLAVIIGLVAVNGCEISDSSDDVVKNLLLIESTNSPDEPITEPSIEGYWRGDESLGDWRDGFRIDFTAIPPTFIYYEDNDLTQGLSGNIVNYSNIEEISGFITIFVTHQDSFGTYLLDKYVTIRWDELSQDTCKEGSPWKLGGTMYFDTPEEAEAEHTIENGYFTMMGTYTRQ